jgi:hypothetical protein
MEIVHPDGRVAARAEHAALTRWTSLKLECCLERYPVEWLEDRAPRRKAAIALVMQLAKAARWTQMHAKAPSYRVPGAEPFSAKAFGAWADKIVLMGVRDYPGPLLLARTGGPDDVQYAWSLMVTPTIVRLFGPDTSAHRKRFDTFFGRVRKAHSAAAWATLGVGHAGELSGEIMHVWRWPYYEPHDLKLLSPPWRTHLGRLWTDVPGVERHLRAWMERHPSIARPDRDGFLVDVRAPARPTERGAARLAHARDIGTLQKRVHTEVNDALHDRKVRRQMRELGLLG